MKEVSKKILPEYFNDVKSGIKTFEVRKDEDDIQVGDILMLEEWKPDGVLTGGYTGRCIRRIVKYVLRDIPQYGLEEGYCIIGLEDINNGWIPCSKRLPETHENVLICQSDGYVNVGWYSLNEFKDMNSISYKDVIAWQPLPDPYIPKQEEQKG